MTKKTVLVVDDEKQILDLIQEMLTFHGYAVLVARHGLEAIYQTNRHHIDLILMDIRMPFFSGFWFCDALRRKKNTCNIPVVMVSGLLDEENTKKAFKVGAVDIVKKPFTEEELLQAVEKNAL